jgi:hypothetical protein
MPNINTNEFLKALGNTYIAKGWVTKDLKEEDYVATIRIPVIKMGLTDGTYMDAKTIRDNKFALQVHITKEQAKNLLKDLEEVFRLEEGESIPTNPEENTDI